MSFATGALLGGLTGALITTDKRNDYTPNSRDLIKKYGNLEIKEIVIGRSPVQQVLTEIMNFISGGDFKKKLKETPYDKLFHLFMIITLANGKKLRLEKNEVIQISEKTALGSDVERKKISFIQGGITLNLLLDNAKKLMGSKYFNYSAYNNNCQDYILALLKASRIGNEQDYNFIKQDTDSLFETNPTLRKIANTATDLGAKANVLIEGRGISGHKNVQSVLFKRPNWTKSRAITWLKKHGFKGLDVDTKPEHYRFRQKDPDAMVLKGYHFVTKTLPKDIELILGMRNIQTMYESDSDSDSNSSDDGSNASSVSDEDEQDIIKSMKNIRKRIKSHSRIHGGKIRIAKHFKKLGKDIKDEFMKATDPLKESVVDAYDIGRDISGGSLSSKELNTLLKASYDIKTKLPDGFIFDKSISSDTSKVFYNPGSKQAVVAHMGTQGILDWGNNAVFALGGKSGYKMTSRFKEAKEVQKSAEKKYGKENITTIGHSQGGLQAEILGTRGKETITVNKATRPLSVFDTTPKNQTDVRSSADIVSAFAPLQKKLKKGITIKSETYDPLVEHATDILDRYDGMIGSGGGNRTQYAKAVKEELKRYSFRELLNEFNRIKSIHFRDRSQEDRIRLRIIRELLKEFVRNQVTDELTEQQILQINSNASDTESEDEEIDGHGISGGKIKIGKKFKKLGKDIGHYGPAMLVGGVPAGLSKAKKINKVVVKPTRKYVGRTDGLLSDVVNYGIPAATSALLGTPAGIFGGPVAGAAASAVGAKLGTMAADKIAKETMIESRTGEGLRRRCRGKGDLIHIDIASHNAKGRKASNSMKGGYLEQEHPVPHRGYDTTTSVPNFSQTLSTKRIRSANALLNMISDQDLKDVKTMLSSRSIENTLSSKQRKDIEKKLKKDFKENVTKAKKNIKAKGSGIRVKGSQEAKDHMAKIREMRKAKKN